MRAWTAPQALKPLRHRGFRLLTAGQVASNVGDACYAVALPWYVLAGHGGALLLGAVLAAYGIPRTLLITIGGYASDRWGPQRVMMVSDIARALAVAALALTASLGTAHAAVLLPIAAVLGAGEGLFLPGSFSIIPSLLPGEDLQAGNALASSGTQLAALAGPAIGGAVVALAGTSPAFAIDAASFAVSAATLAGLARLRGAQPAPLPATPAPAGPADPATETAAEPPPALRTLLRTERILLVILVVNIAANVGMGGIDGVALPALAHGPFHAGAGAYGAVLAAFGGGALAGTIAVGQVRGIRRPAFTASFFFLAEAACIGLVPYLGGIPGAAAAMAGLGIANGFGNILTMTAFQQWAPPALLGRLTGLLLLTSFGVFPLSVALGALFVRDLGPASFFLFAAGTLAAAIAFGLTQRSWREFGADQSARVNGAPGGTAAPVRTAPSLEQRPH